MSGSNATGTIIDGDTTGREHVSLLIVPNLADELTRCGQAYYVHRAVCKATHSSCMLGRTNVFTDTLPLRTVFCSKSARQYQQQTL